MKLVLASGNFEWKCLYLYDEWIYISFCKPSL